MAEHAVRELMDRTFEEIALVLGGAFAVHSIQDEAVWQIMKSLDAIHDKAVAKLAGPAPRDHAEPGQPTLTPHPAVEALLRKLRKRT